MSNIFIYSAFRIPWLDREAMIKKMERLQKENLLLVHKLEEATAKKENFEFKESPQAQDGAPNYQVKLNSIRLIKQMVIIADQLRKSQI